MVRAIPVLRKEAAERMLAAVHRQDACGTRPGLIGVAVPHDLEEAESRGFWIGFFVALGCVLFWVAVVWTVTRF